MLASTTTSCGRRTSKHAIHVGFSLEPIRHLVSRLEPALLGFVISRFRNQLLTRNGGSIACLAPLLLITGPGLSCGIVLAHLRLLAVGIDLRIRVDQAVYCCVKSLAELRLRAAHQQTILKGILRDLGQFVDVLVQYLDLLEAGDRPATIGTPDGGVFPVDRGSARIHDAYLFARLAKTCR